MKAVMRSKADEARQCAEGERLVCVRSSPEGAAEGGWRGAHWPAPAANA